MKTYQFTELPPMPPLPSRKVRHPASTVAAPTFIEVFDWQPAHLRPAVVLTASFGGHGQTLGEAMRSFVVVRAWDLQIGASTRSVADRWCWWDDFVAALHAPAITTDTPAAELSATKARLAQLTTAFDQFVESIRPL